MLFCGNVPNYSFKGNQNRSDFAPLNSGVMVAGQGRTMEYDLTMNSKLRQLPLDERIRLVEDLWGSIAIDQAAIPLSSEQISELDLCLDAYEDDGEPGRPAHDVISEMRKRL